MTFKNLSGNLSKVKDPPAIFSGSASGAKPVALLLPYQIDWVTDKNNLLICEKGRQIGFSWSDSCKSVIDAIRGINTYYTSYNHDTTKNYIRNAHRWAALFNVASRYYTGRQIIDDSEFLTYKLKFNNGAEIETLAGNSTNLRDKQGNIVIDEGAFRDNLKDIIDAALAIIIHGGKIRVFSTHFGMDNYFNELCQDAEKRGFIKYKVPFKLAVNQGLYQRICLKKGELWSQEKEDHWVSELYRKYGVASAQELDCIPDDQSGMSIFKASNFNYVEWDEIAHNIVFTIRAWDLAATEKDGCYSVGSKIHLLQNGCMVWDCSVYGQWGATEGDKKIADTCNLDGYRVPVIIEQEAGSHSIRWEQQIRNDLPQYLIEFVKPIGDKLIRAVPLANDIINDRFVVLNTLDNRELVPKVCEFTGKKKELVTDLVDSLSLGRNYLNNFENSMLGL